MLVVDPRTSPPTFWTATAGSGIWKSTDGGLTWVPKSKGLLNLMVDAVRPDPYHPTRMYAAQAPQQGNGGGKVYVSPDAGENWYPVQACGGKFAPVTHVTNLAVGPETISPAPVWVTQSASNSECGMVFRSDNAGADWCSYHEYCDQLWGSTECSGTLPVSFGNDGQFVQIVPRASASDPDEVYVGSNHDHITAGSPCRGVQRADPAAVAWDHRDAWVGPIDPLDPVCNGEHNLRTWKVAFDPTAGNQGKRFGFHRLWDSPDLHSYFLAKHTGTNFTLSGDRAWNEVLDLKLCYGFTSANTVPAWLTVSVAGGKHRVFAQIDGSTLLYCDGDADVANCFDDQHWECIWNFGSTPIGEACGKPNLACAAQTHDFGTNVTWTRAALFPGLSPSGYNEILLEAQRRAAKNDLLRLYHDGSAWKEEYLRDPVTCDPSGPSLLSPLEFVEITPTTLLASSPRHLLKSTNSGATWSVPDTNAFKLDALDGFYQLGPRLAQAPFNPSVIYLQDAYGLFRTVDGGANFFRLALEEEGKFEHRCAEGKALSICGTEVIPPGCGHGDVCGRYNRSCGGISQIIVDAVDPDVIYAATERGLWRWEYPFTGTTCHPNIPQECLTTEATAYAGESWSELPAATCPSPFTCMRERVVRTLAQHRVQPNRLLAGGPDGLYVSRDGGDNWELVLTADVSKVVTLPAPKQDLVLVATESGVYRSLDGGDTFTPTEMITPARDVSAYVPPAGPATIYAVGMDWDEATYDEGIYRGENDGEPGFWVKLRATLDNQKFLSVFARSDGAVFAGQLGDGIVQVTPETASCANQRLTTRQATPSLGASKLGTAIAGLGDVQDPTGHSYCQSRPGVVQITAASTATIRILKENGSDWRTPASSSRPLAQHFASLAGVGDVDPAPDGCPDAALGLPIPAPTGSAGVVELWSLCANPPTLIQTLQPGVQYFGFSLARSGNYLAVGAPADALALARVYIYRLDALSAPLFVIPAPAGTLRFGWSLAFGDVDGNGSLDLAVGSPAVDIDGNSVPPGNGFVHVYSGVDTWASLQPPTWTLAGPANSAFGFSLSSGYDRRGSLGSFLPDGNADLLVGAPLEGGTGRAHWYGNMSDAGVALSGEASGDGFGFAVVLARDVTGDYRPDALVGAPWNTKAPRISQGTTYVFEDSIAPSCDELRGSIDYGQYGRVLAEVGDVDKNRHLDITVGQPDPAGASGGVAAIHAVLR